MSTGAFLLAGIVIGLMLFIRTKAKDDDMDGVL